MKDKINMAVVGLAFGQYIVEDQILKGPGNAFVRITGVCDLNRERAATVGGRNQLPQYESLDDILADQKVEAVGLFTGPAGRAKLIRKIIRAGKHVMTTKPFELDAEEAFAVLREARESCLAVHLNSPGPVMEPESRQIVTWAEEFDLGRPVSFHWETHASYYEKAGGSWHDDPEKCPAAPVFRLGIYGINQFTRLFGSVEELGSLSHRLRTGRPTSDNAMIFLRFRNGMLGSIHASFCVSNGYPYAHDLTINYERGTIRSHAVATDQYGTNRKRLWLETPGPGGEIIRPEAALGSTEMVGCYDWESFHRAVRNGGRLDGEVSPEQIVAGVQVIAAMAEAERTGRSVRIKFISVDSARPVPGRVRVANSILA